uniref:Oxidoreductase-like domain-containing protein n=1 Tax=Heterorhabditis bacteriophora TaxID=37862 RepID=A0A1I7XEM7_HETBA
MSMLNEETTSDKIIRLVREHVRENDGNGQIVCEPQEPNPQDCCGQSCIPCVFDIHREDVLRWAKECAKTISYEGTNLYTYIYHDEVKCDTENSENAFSTKNYKNFKITAITQLSPDTNLYAFEIKDEVPNVLLGSYLRAR